MSECGPLMRVCVCVCVCSPTLPLTAQALVRLRHPPLLTRPLHYHSPRPSGEGYGWLSRGSPETLQGWNPEVEGRIRIMHFCSLSLIFPPLVLVM